MSENPKRVALIGYGLAGSAFHAPLIASTEGLELAAVVTRDAERRQELAARHPDAVALDSADDLWRTPEKYDLVVVAAPNKTHVKLAEGAVRAGLPVVVDKPLAASTEQAQELIDLARERKVMLTVFQNRRWDGDFLTVKRLIEEDRLGTVWRFESRYERWRPNVSDGWRESEDPSEAGGVLYDLGAHLVDQALTLFGPAARIHGERAARREGAKVDDDAFVAIVHRSGVTSHLWMSSVAAQPGPRFRVLGSKAAYVKYGMDPQEAQLRAGVTPGGRAWGLEDRGHYGKIGDTELSRPVPTEQGDYRHFYRQMVDVLKDGVPPPVDAADAVATLAIVEQIRSENLL
jgi:predicted dehydrogenase